LDIEKKFKIFCKNLCLNDCIQDEYILIERDNTLPLENLKLTSSWDESKPFITNIETPVMTFNDYIYYIGGLFGMWFGTNANNLFKSIWKIFQFIFANLLTFSLFYFIHY
jgi:hypothetical protein